MSPTVPAALSQVDQDYIAVQGLEATYNGDLGQAPALAQATANAQEALNVCANAQTANSTQTTTDAGNLVAGYLKLASSSTALANALAPPAPPAPPAPVITTEPVTATITTDPQTLLPAGN
jgi:hypothetical protein